MSHEDPSTVDSWDNKLPPSVEARVYEVQAIEDQTVSDILCLGRAIERMKSEGHGVPEYAMDLGHVPIHPEMDMDRRVRRINNNRDIFKRALQNPALEELEISPDLSDTPVIDWPHRGLPVRTFVTRLSEELALMMHVYVRQEEGSDLLFPLQIKPQLWTGKEVIDRFIGFPDDDQRVAEEKAA